MLDKKYYKFSKDDLARLYSPSSMVDDFNVFIQEYIDLSYREKINAKNAMFDVIYGENQGLDFFKPINKNTGYLMIYIHGGYWQELSKNESLFMVSNYQKHGIAVAVIDYDLCPINTVGGIVEQCRKSIAYLAKNADKFGFNKNKIIVSGSFSRWAFSNYDVFNRLE